MPVRYSVRLRDAHDITELYLGSSGMTKHPETKGFGVFCLKCSVLAASYSCLSTTIASTGLNCRVRNENGCDPGDKPPEQSA